jgi:type II secretory pathway pseudopilin PulG
VTLVELLVVMMVLSILASLILSGILVAKSNAAIAKTASTIRKLHEVVMPYYEEYQTRRPVLPDVTQLLQRPNGRTDLTDLRRIAIRRLMTLELPDRPSDVTATLASGTQRYQKTYGNVKCILSEVPPVARRYRSIIGGLSSGQVANNPELLHMIVTRGPVADADVVSHFRPDEVSDLDKDGLPEFVDGWGKPIHFRRWPIGFASPAQPIDGSRRTIDAWFSGKGHRLVPLIFSGGPDRTLDVELMPDLEYARFDFDPFRFDPSAGTSQASSPIRADEATSRIRGEVVLTPVVRTNGPLTFFAARLDASGTFANPPLDADCTAQTRDAFFTAGSERDIGSADDDVPNGRVESLDNIHNHDLAK